ncbi:MAG: tellurium resistance protein TerC [Chloroflexi bacterium]|nr:MAG: tellurium resistance protein TerC [Chloroflexota bacterium]
MDVNIVGPLLSIIAIDLVLSGDNAVVIGMAARRLPAYQRRKAIIWGGAGAIILRITFTILAALLLDVPLLQAGGGLLLIWIAVKLLRPFSSGHANVAEADTLGAAIRTIILADAVMSLDNMLAVGGAAHGHIGLLLFGLALSIPILLLGSSIISVYIARYPWLNYVGAAVLVHTALKMFFSDGIVHEYFAIERVAELAVMVAITAVVVLYGIYVNRKAGSNDTPGHGGPPLHHSSASTTGSLDG